MPNTVWGRIKNVPPIVASIIAVLAAIVTVVTWVTGYFATQKQLEYVQCISDANEELLSIQVTTANLYSNYINKILKLKRLTEQDEELSVSEQQETQKLEADTEREWSKIINLDKKADKLASSLMSGQCGKSGEV